MKKLLTFVIVLLIFSTVSMHIPMTAQQLAASITNGKSYNMYNSVDVFRGSFSPSNNLTLQVNQTIEVAFRIKPILNATNATVSIISPRNLIEASGILKWNGNIQANETVQLNFSVKAIKEMDGYIRAITQAYFDDQKIENSYYLHIRTPGASNSTDVVEEHSLVQAETSALSSTGYITVKGRFVYLNEWGGYSPMRQCKVVLYDSDPWNPYVEIATSETDDNGNYYFYVPNDDGWLQDGLDVFVGVRSENPAAITKTGELIPRVYEALTPKHDDVPDGSTIDYGTRVPTQYNEAWQAIDAVLTEYRWIENKVGWHRSRVLIKWPYWNWPVSTGDEIWLCDKTAYPWDHVTLYHEYAHCVMYTAYGNRWPSTAHRGERHYVFSEKDGGFALIEGWAEFMQAAVDNNPNNLASKLTPGMNIETNTWYNVSVWTPDLGWQGDVGDMDGNDVEGSVASIFWDIFDPINDDPLYLGFDEIWSVIINDNPEDMNDFWYHWFSTTDNTPTNYDYLASMNTIYWKYGIDKNNPPTVKVVFPNAWGLYRGTIYVEASASDIDGTVKSVEFWYNLYTNDPNDGRWRYIGNDLDPSDGWKITWDTNSITDSSVWIKAIASDGMESSSDVSDSHFALDNTVPIISVKHSPLSPSDADSVTFAISASDASEGDSWLVYVTLYWYDGSWHSEQFLYYCTPSFSTTFDVGNFPPGTIKYYATAEDCAGNVGRYPSSGYESFNVIDDDDEGPTPSNPSTDPSGAIYDDYAGYIRFKIYWSDPSGVSKVKFEFWADSKWIGAYDPTDSQVDAEGNGWYYFDMPKHAFVAPPRPGWGDYVGKQIKWHSAAWDADNDREDDSAWTDTGILDGPYIRDDDTEGPSITIFGISEYNGDGDGVIEDDEQIKISWSLYDPSGIYSTSCTVDDITPPVQDTYFVIFGPLKPGDHTFTISATDNDYDGWDGDRATNTKSGSFTVVDDDTTPPQGISAQPPDGQVYHSDYPDDIRIEVAWTDDTGIADVRFYYKYKGSSWVECTPSGHSGNVYWYNISRSEWTMHIGEEIQWYSKAWDSDSDWPNDQLTAVYPSPPYTIRLMPKAPKETVTEIVGGAEAVIDRFSGGPNPSTVTFAVKVKVIETGQYLSHVGKVEFYVNGELVGSDNDEDADSVYEITWDPPSSWLTLGSQTWEARFTGTADYGPSSASSTITIHGQLYQTLMSPKGGTYNPGDTFEIVAQITSDSPAEDNIKGCIVKAAIIAPDGTSWATIDLTDPDNDGIYAASFTVTGDMPEGLWKIGVHAQKDDYHECTLPPIEAFYVEVPKLPDLTITRVWWDPEYPVEGDDITIYITEANIGDADAGSHTDRVIVFLDELIIFRFEFSDPGLAAGTSRTFQFTIPNAVAGTYHIKVILDVNNVVLEKDETNNVWEGDITVAGWVRYVPTAEQTEIEISTIGGVTYVKVTLTFPDAGYRVTDWGVISSTDNEFSADAKVERWTGVSAHVITSFSHTYELGKLPQDTYTFTFTAWGAIVESEEFTIAPPKAGVEVSIDPTTASVELKHSVEYAVYVHNTGGETDTYDITVEGIDPSWYSLSATSVTIEPGQTVEVTLTITPPCSALTYDEEETYAFTVKATSQTDPTIWDAVDAELTVYITWEYVYEDPVRHTILKMSTDNKCFRFITPDKDFGIRKATAMYEGYVTVYYNSEYVDLPAVIIRHNDGELRLLAYAGTDVPFCYARALDYETGKRYMLRVDPKPPE